MDIAGLQPEPVHGRKPADRIAALAVPHQFWFCRGAGGEIQQHRIVGMRRAVRRERLRKLRGLLERQPALMRRRRTDDNTREIAAAEAGEFRDLILRRHHHLGAAAIEPILQFIRRQQRGRRNHHHAELDRRQHGLPQRDDIAEQQQQMIAALQALRAQEIRDLVGTARQRLEREFCLAVAAGIDDPQRRAAFAVGVARQLRIEPVQRPVEGDRIGPAEIRHRLVVVGAVFQQERAGFLEGRHVMALHTLNVSTSRLILRSRALARRLEGWPQARTSPSFETLASRSHLRMTACHFCANPRTCWMMPEKSTPPFPAASNAL